MINMAPTIVAKPDPIRHAGYVAYPVCGLDGRPTHWEVHGRTKDGRDCVIASLTDEQIKDDAIGVLEAMAAKKPYAGGSNVYAGQKCTKAERKDLQRQIFERGADARRHVSDWVRYLGAEELRQGGELDAVLDEAPPEQWPAVVRELFGGLYGLDGGAPLESPPEGSEWIEKLHSTAAALPEFQELQAETQGDPWRCGMAAAQIARRLAEALKDELKDEAPRQDPARLKEEAQALADLGASKKAQAQAQAKVAQAQAQAKELAESLDEKELGEVVVQAIQEGAAEALAALDGMDEAMNGLSAGTGSPELQVCNATPDAIRKALARNAKLKRIATLAGRLRMAARKAQKTKTKYLPEETVDVTMGGEISRLLPSELVLLADEGTEMIVARKLIERQALEYQREGTEKLERGPVVACVDGSGSMQGERHEWAMGVCLALLEVAKKQNRGFVLIHFDERVKQVFEVPKPRALELSTLEAMVCFFSGGGTDFRAPLKKAHDLITAGKAWKRADVVLVTDGQAYWDDWPQRLKNSQIALYGIAIQCAWSKEQAKELSEAVEITEKQMREDASKVDAVFAL